MLYWIFVLSTLVLITYVLLETYCSTVKNNPDSLKIATSNQYLKPIFKVLDEKACVHIENKTSLSQNILKYFHLLKFNT